MPKTIKKQTAKKIRTAAAKSATKKAPRPAKKLSKKDPNYYSKIGAISAAKRKISPEQFSEWAKRSHPRKEYKGGRPKSEV